MANINQYKSLYVYAYWISEHTPALMGTLNVGISRGQEIFSFEYNDDWLDSGFAQILDPELGLYSGPKYTRDEKANFGLFLDSSPDRWGRMLMRRREAALAKAENRSQNSLYESDFLLGVNDGHRMGGLRFKLDPNGEFLDNNSINASPLWASLRDLEYASEYNGAFTNCSFDKSFLFLKLTQRLGHESTSQEKKNASKGNTKLRYSLYLDIYYRKGKRRGGFLGIYLEPNEDKTYRNEKLN